MHIRYRILVVLIIWISIGCENENGGGNIGQGGSMTRFAIQGNVLYVVDNAYLQVFDIADDQFSKIREQYVGEEIETIFASNEYLYLGSRSAMFIYSIFQEDNPVFVFEYTHVRSCDPVIVSGNRAYVTLRSGSPCSGGNNTLEILDITDKHQPQLIKAYSMTEPHGLGVKNDRLFICEGEYGIKMFDIANELDIIELDAVTNIHAFDVIVFEETIIVTGDDGVFQFGYSTDEFSLLSTIPVFEP